MTALRTWLCVNTTVYHATWTITWIAFVESHDYAATLGYAIAVAVLHAVCCAAIAWLGYRAQQSARAALVIVTVGGGVAGLLLVLVGTSVIDKLLPLIVVTLAFCDPAALLPTYARVYESRAAAAGRDSRASRCFGGGDASIGRQVQASRTLGLLLGAFAIVGGIVEDSSRGVFVVCGLVLVGAQIPLMPIVTTPGGVAVDDAVRRAPLPGDSDDPAVGADGDGGGAGAVHLDEDGGETCAASRLARVSLAPTAHRVADLCIAPALVVDVAASLSLAIAVATWAHTATADWASLYPSAALAWAVNTTALAFMVVAAWTAYRSAASIAPTDADGGAALDDDSFGVQTRAHARLHATSALKIHQRLLVHGACLVAAVFVSAFVDAGLTRETPLQSAIAVMVLCVSLYTDQVATQCAALSNSHVRGTHLDATLTYALGAARASVYAFGFLLAWFWRAELHVAAYVFALVPLAYLRTRMGPAAVRDWLDAARRAAPPVAPRAAVTTK